MNLPQTVSEVLRHHVVLECESIDRMYLNVYVPQLQHVGGVVGYLHAHHGQRFASTVAVAPMTEAFVKAIDRFATERGIDVVQFEKWQRKDDLTQQYLARFSGTEGVLYIGKAQEKAQVARTERRRNPQTGATYPWIVSSTAMVNHFYFYCVRNSAAHSPPPTRPSTSIAMTPNLPRKTRLNESSTTQSRNLAYAKQHQTC